MGRVPASSYDRKEGDVMSRRDVLVDPTETHVIVELIDVETTYYYLTAAQTTPEHRVVNDE